MLPRKKYQKPVLRVLHDVPPELSETLEAEAAKLQIQNGTGETGRKGDLDPAQSDTKPPVQPQ